MNGQSVRELAVLYSSEVLTQASRFFSEKTKNGGSRRLRNGGHRNFLRKSKINGLIILKVF
jgi:hypothetical protein